MYAQQKAVVAVNCVSATAGATVTSSNIDLLGYDQATIDVTMTTADNVTNSPTVLKIQESDDTNASNFADITEAVGGGVGGFTIGNVVTSGVNNWKFNVDARKRKRYLRTLHSPRTTQIACVVANLSKAEQAPITAAKANALALVEF